MARDIERQNAEIAAVNVMAGFSFADTADAGVSFAAVKDFGDPEKARGCLRQLRDSAIENRQRETSWTLRSTA